MRGTGGVAVETAGETGIGTGSRGESANTVGSSVRGCDRVGDAKMSLSGRSANAN